MSDWVDVEAVDALPPGSVKVVEVDGAMIAVFNVDGEFFAIEDVCTHDGAEIASGCLRGDEIECPRHGARFNVRTGAVLSAPAYERRAPLIGVEIRVQQIALDHFVNHEIRLQLADQIEFPVEARRAPVPDEVRDREALRQQ